MVIFPVQSVMRVLIGLLAMGLVALTGCSDGDQRAVSDSGSDFESFRVLGTNKSSWLSEPREEPFIDTQSDEPFALSWGVRRARYTNYHISAFIHNPRRDVVDGKEFQVIFAHDCNLPNTPPELCDFGPGAANCYIDSGSPDLDSYCQWGDSEERTYRFSLAQFLSDAVGLPGMYRISFTVCLPTEDGVTQSCSFKDQVVEFR